MVVLAVFKLTVDSRIELTKECQKGYRSLTILVSRRSDSSGPLPEINNNSDWRHSLKFDYNQDESLFHRLQFSLLLSVISSNDA